jgi:hypothetical protein
MKDKKHIRRFNESEENLNSEPRELGISDVSCRCLDIKEISKKRVKELIGLKKYARDQFTVGLIDSQIKYWSELQ